MSSLKDLFLLPSLCPVLPKRDINQSLVPTFTLRLELKAIQCFTCEELNLLGNRVSESVVFRASPPPPLPHFCYFEDILIVHYFIFEVFFFALLLYVQKVKLYKRSKKTKKRGHLT